MRILHTADWHLGKNLEGVSRLEEQALFLNDFIKIVEEEKIDLVIIAGDIYDTSNPPSQAEKLFYETLKSLSDFGTRLTLVISGNHDNPNRLVSARALASEHGIIMVGTPNSEVEIGEYGKHQVVNSGKGYVEIDINGEKAVVLTVPYPSEKRLDEIYYTEEVEDDEQADVYNNRIRKLFFDLSENFREDTINIITSHLFAMGAEETGSERSIQLGGSYIIDSSCFPKTAQYVALGHIHKPMVVPGTDKRVRYSGSPLHYSKKERHFEKGCYILDIKANEELDIKFRPFDVYKPIEVWKCDSIEEAISKCELMTEENSYVYLEVKTDRYINESEIKQMKKFKKDILEIIPIIENIEMEQSHMTNFVEKPFEEIFEAYYTKVRGVKPDQEVVNLLMSIMNKDGGSDETN